MPTIVTTLCDLRTLWGEKVEPEALRKQLAWVKGELKDWPADTSQGSAEVKIELNDTNRPDTWTAEGIMRQLKGCAGRGYPRYPFLDENWAREVEVDPSVLPFRPVIGAFLATGVAVDDGLLRALIQTQEKLSETFGRKRKDIAAGIYKLDRIEFPVRYTTVAPGDPGFVPLGETRVMTPARILAEHPKGREYASILAAWTRYPILVDARGRVLSMPPVINSADVGAVEVGDTSLFVEFTGNDRATVTTALNIMAADMADRGFRIQRVQVRPAGPGEGMGKLYEKPAAEGIFPTRMASQSMELSLAEVDRALGVALPEAEVKDLLERYGYKLEWREGQGRARRFRATCPFYRNDLLHPMDVVEDVAIARGYDSFVRARPTDYTVGRLTPVEVLAQRMRVRMAGLGFQEMATPVLTAKATVTERVGRPDGHLVEIANPMSENFAVVRDSLLASLLAIEEASYRSAYPHKLFECGEIARKAPGALMGSETRRQLAALLAHGGADFPELHAVLESLLYGLGWHPTLRALPVPGYMDGRVGLVAVEDRVVGVIGAVDPAVLERFSVRVPAVAFELDLGELAALPTR